MKKLLIIALALLFALSALTACGQGAEESDPEPAAEPAEETAVPAEAEAEPAGIALGGTGYATWPGDTVAATVDGSEVTWTEYHYWLLSYVEYIQQLAAQYGARLSGWGAYELSPTTTNGEVVISHAQTTVIQDHAVREKVTALGGGLTAEDEAEIESIFDQNADLITGDGNGETTDEERAAFEDYLASEVSIDKAFFDSLNVDLLLTQRGFEILYGEGGADLSDAEVLAYAEANGLLAARHILLLTVDPDTLEPLPDEVIAQKSALAAQLYGQLSAVQDDPEALETLFDELTAAYTEDTGYATYPNGYVFAEGEMIEAFEDAVKSLEIGELSGIVESGFGYHIILRIPIDPDAVIGTDANGNLATLRYSAAAQLYNDQLITWTDEAEVVWNEGFETPDLQAIFG